MANQFVQVATDGSGKKIQTFENTVNAQTVEAQAVCLVDSAGVEKTALPVTDNNGSLTVDGTVTVTPPAVTKGTQGATGFTIQSLKDAGRSQVCLAWEEMAGTANVESTLTNFTSGSRGAAALSAATNLTVTAGKTLRIQTVTIYVKATSTVNNLARFRIRQAASSIANSSPIIFDAVIALDAPGTIAAGLCKALSINIPDGLEVAGGQQITFTWLTAANTCTVGMTLVGYEY